MRKLLLRLSASWALGSPRARAKKLRSLAATERGSYLTLQWAAQETESSARAALYLRHAMDEARHARLFWERANALWPAEGPLLADSEDLFRRLGEREFLAFVTHGERRGREQFEIYERYLRGRGFLEDAELFARIAADERHHESYSKKLLEEQAGSDAEAARSLSKVRLWEAWRSWRRVGRRLSLGIYTCLIWALFPVILPYALITRPLQKRQVGWRRPRLEEARPGGVNLRDG